MADYIYLLENRLSPAQRHALVIARDVARAKGLTIFLVGGAVRDLTSGSPVRDLDVVVQGSALKLKKDLEKAGAIVTGENEAGQALYLRLPGHVRMEFGSTLAVTFSKPGKPTVRPATILEDLRRRDFTANAMALSLNEGSYGLLMDPLNGIADIENRHLRLVSNYGFIEDPVRMVKAARLMARLGWTMDERTRLRYETGKEEGYLSALSEFHRGYELEEIVHEEDPLRVMRGLESEGWMKKLSPFWSSAKANTAELEKLREAQTQLEMQNIHPDNGAANFPLLTARLSAQEVATLKASFPRQGFVEEIEALEGVAKQFAAQLAGKSAALPSEAWKLITSAPPEAVLWVAYSNKNAGVQAKLKSFSTEWPQARQKMPYVQMQEMRITADVPGYGDLLEKLFFELMDGKLQTPEELKAFLEPYSPPAPPPPVNLRRMRAAKKEPKPRASKAKAKQQPDEEISDVEVRTSAAEDVAAAPESGKGTKPASPAAPKARSRTGAKGPVETAASVQIEVPIKAAVKGVAGAIKAPTKAVAAKQEPAKTAAVQAKPSSQPAKAIQVQPVRSGAVVKSPKGPAAPAVKKANAPPAKKAPAALPSSKKAASKKAPAKKAQVTKAPTKKAPVKKVVVKHIAPKKAVLKKATAQKKIATKSAANKTSATKKFAVKTSGKKTSAKKGSAREVLAKAGERRGAQSKAGARVKPAPKKTLKVVKKVAAKKAAPKSNSGKPARGKKTAVKLGRRR